MVGKGLTLSPPQLRIISYSDGRQTSRLNCTEALRLVSQTRFTPEFLHCWYSHILPHVAGGRIIDPPNTNSKQTVNRLALLGDTPRTRSCFNLRCNFDGCEVPIPSNIADNFILNLPPLLLPRLKQTNVKIKSDFNEVDNLLFVVALAIFQKETKYKIKEYVV